MFKGLGVNHIGMGVNDLGKMKEFYGQTLEFNKIMAVFEDTWNPMSEMFRASTHKLDGIMFSQEAGGIVVELIRMSIPNSETDSEGGAVWGHWRK